MRRTSALLAVLLLAFSSCTNDDDAVLVMAAASLTDAFEELETVFEAANPTISIDLNLAGSTALREQILQGAPAGVFASANAPAMAAVITQGEASVSQVFATNELVIAVPTDNPGRVHVVGDLVDPDLLVGLCAVGVPCGDFARMALDQAGVVPSVDTNEGNVRALLTKIAAGELDAGIVYATDVASSSDVAGIALPGDISVDISYPIAVLTNAPNAEGAQAFVDFVLSAQGQSILASHAFGAP